MLIQGDQASWTSRLLDDEKKLNAVNPTILDHISCPGTFKLTRKERRNLLSQLIVFNIPLHRKCVKKNREYQNGNCGSEGKYSIHDRDNASQSNNGLYQQRVKGHSNEITIFV